MSGVQFVNGRADSDRLRAEMNHAGETFDARLLSDFYMACYTGCLPDVQRQMFTKTKADLNKHETHMKFTSLLCVAAGSQRVVPNPRSDHVSVASYLISHGADPNAQDVYGYTPVMHITSRSSRLDVAKALLEGGADPNIRNQFGCVALHESVMANNDKACSLLCDYGADPNIKDVDGVTPYRCSTAFPLINMILTNATKKLKGEKVVLPVDVKKCVQCDKPAPKRCSRCQIVWYCSAECQKLHWKVHKPDCKKPDTYIAVDIKNIQKRIY